MARKKKGKRTYGSGSYFRREGRDTWTIAWRENGVRRFMHGIASEELARKALAGKVGAVAEGRTSIPASSPHTLNALAKPWLEARAKTHRSVYDDQNRWTNHIEPTVGKLTPNKLTVPVLKDFLAAKVKEGLSTSTVNRLVRLLSTFYTDLIEDGRAQTNPCRSLSKKTKAKYLREAHDPKNTPYVESMADVVRIYQALQRWPAVATAYAIGALAGLRTNEVRALRWEHVDLTTRRIHVQVQVERRQGRDPSTFSAEHVQSLKNDESRTVPIQPSLVAILTSWQQQSAAKDLVCPPLTSRGTFLDEATMSKRLRKVLGDLGLTRPGLRWYQATRHTYASQWVLSGGSLETLRRMLGHSSVTVTERYAHLMPSSFSDADQSRLAVDFGTDSGAIGCQLDVKEEKEERVKPAQIP